MGIADLIPGISGGTVALLTGIYEQLIRILACLNGKFIRSLIFFDGKTLITKYRIDFLAALGAGIMSGIIGTVYLINYALTHYLPVTFAFFAGLVCGALITIIDKNIHKGFLMIGIAAGFALVLSKGISMSFSLLNIFFAGSIAVCAMLLPGISGSFILLLLGIYQPLMAAILAADFIRISVFMAGALLGVFLFSRLINMMLRLYKKPTLSVLIGLMIGTFIKLWPWQQQEKGLLLLSPSSYTEITSDANYLFGSIAFFILGCAAVVLLKRTKTKGS